MTSTLFQTHSREFRDKTNFWFQLSLPPAVLPTVALPTPVKAKSLEAYLTGDQEVSRQPLLAGSLHGFRLHFQGPREGSCSNNLVSASEHADIVDHKLANEIQAGRIIRPFKKIPVT